MTELLSQQSLLLAALFFVAAALYGSVGHAGASAYLASMAFVGMGQAEMKPTALILNLCAGSLVAFQFIRAGYFNWRLFWPFAVTSIPAALLCGQVHLPDAYYKPLIGFALACAALRLWLSPKAAKEEPEAKTPPLALALLAGAVVGVLAGLTGTGGGIFLSPLLVLAGWATLKQASGVAAPIILVNSAAGLIGWLGSQYRLTIPLPFLEMPPAKAPTALPAALPLWILAVLMGGGLGSLLGSKRFGTPALRRLLAVVLVIAAGKLMLNL